MVPAVIFALERKRMLVHLGFSNQMIQLNSCSRSREDLISEEVKVFLRCYLRLCYYLQTFTGSFISHQHTQPQHTQTHAYLHTNTNNTHTFIYTHTHTFRKDKLKDFHLDTHSTVWVLFVSTRDLTHLTLL